ncbi:hypothetical protein SCLARK_001578 [Spiroplasma clarkii]|uniref:Ribosomal processing cysteine protease Prp n=1 Tax=Spiroplasma clarkii TaxID=2139 RepID=A0A1Y0L2Z2_9MOLU|nr:ribosomal-processing cysteine protease Prp [Spiroplasma clarkii]ARU92078.1 hypothetical protein SCLARK_001578 [Spiroplasma clarkii]ATX71406.1 hypothetical protein SCLAR_v1c11060 [Spiroplasma clarkii]
MVQAKVTFREQTIQLIEITGHAEAGEFGNDLVCAGITAIVSGALNGLDLLHHSKVKLTVLENQIIIKVIKQDSDLQKLLQFLLIQLQTINVQYPKNFAIEEVL